MGRPLSRNERFRLPQQQRWPYHKSGIASPRTFSSMRTTPRTRSASPTCLAGRRACSSRFLVRLRLDAEAALGNKRLQRFSALVDNDKVVAFNLEPPGQMACSLAPKILEQL